MDLKTFLDGYKQHGGVATHWVWVGPNGRATRPMSGGVLPYYGLCADHAESTIKTIVNTFFVESVAVHPHNFHYRCGPCRSALKALPTALCPRHHAGMPRTRWHLCAGTTC